MKWNEICVLERVCWLFGCWYFFSTPVAVCSWCCCCSCCWCCRCLCLMSPPPRSYLPVFAIIVVVFGPLPSFYILFCCNMLYSSLRSLAFLFCYFSGGQSTFECEHFLIFRSCACIFVYNHHTQNNLYIVRGIFRNTESYCLAF